MWEDIWKSTTTEGQPRFITIKLTENEMIENSDDSEENSEMKDRCGKTRK